MAAILLALVLGAPASAGASPSLVGQWLFDEHAGQSALDDGPYGLDARLGSTNAADASDPDRVAGLSGGALRFDGASYARLPESAEFDLQTLSAEAVVRAPKSPGSWRYIVSRGAHGCHAGSYGLYSAKSGGIAFYVYDGTRFHVSATARPSDVWNGAWHHVAGTFDGRGLRLYVDGRAVGEPVVAPPTIDYATTSTSTYFGSYAGGCNLAFAGDVDMVRLSSGALDAGALAAAARRALERTPPPSGSLPPAAPGGALWGPRNHASGGKRRVPGAPPRACQMRLSHKRIRARRRSVLAVRVSVRTNPLARVRVTVRRAGKRKIIARSRTSAAGRARLRFRVRRSGRLRVTANAVPRCEPAYVRVRRARRAT